MVTNSSEHASRPNRPRLVGAIGTAWATLMGMLPHVLHHIGPLAGAAIIAGTTGIVIFGLLALALTIPVLIRVQRRCGNWRIPAVLLGIMLAAWSASTWVFSPWVQDKLAEPKSSTRTNVPSSIGTDKNKDHEKHHIDNTVNSQ